MNSRLHSFAKLNLSLNVYQVERSGYHPLRSVFQTISLYDILDISFTANKAFSMTMDYPGFNEPNILEVLYGNIANQLDFGLEIHLTKRIPIGAGLGGGSSNAGALLGFLAPYLGYSDEKLLSIASKIGSDVPFFLKGGTAMVSGYGEVIEPYEASIPYQYYVVVSPNKPCSTVDIYRDFDRSCSPAPLPETYSPPVLGFNDLASCVYKRLPELNILKDFCDVELQLPLYVTGSGSATYIPCSSSEAVSEAISLLKKHFPVYSYFPTQSTSYGWMLAD